MRCLSVLAMAALSGLPCAARPLTAANVRSEIAECPAAAHRLKIERVTIVGSEQHNQVRRHAGQKADGRAGQRYAVVYVRSQKRVVPITSLGPLDAAVKPDDFQALRGADYCSVDDD